MIHTLILKNLRVQRAVIAVASVAGLLGYVILVLPVLLLPEWMAYLIFGHAWNVAALEQGFIIAAVLGLLSASVILPALAGVAVATERQRRWAEFEFMLPVPRWKIVLAKLATAAGVAVVWFGLHVALCYAASRYSAGLMERQLTALNVVDRDFIQQQHAELATAWRQAFAGLAGGTAAAFGVAWLMSVVQRNAVIATVAGLGVVVGCAVLLIFRPMTDLSGQQFEFADHLRTFLAVVLPLAAVTLAVGTGVALGRQGT